MEDTILPPDPFGPMYYRTQTALRYLIQNSLDFQLTDFGKDQRAKHGFGVDWINSFCTIRVAGPRRTGHTTAMLKVGLELFKKPVFLSLNQHTADWTKETAEKMYSQKIQTASHQSFKTRLRGMAFDGILVDCGFFMSKSAQEELASIAVGCGSTFETFCLAYIE